MVRLERELGRRSAFAAWAQVLGYALFRMFLGRVGPVPAEADVAGATVLAMMFARIGLQQVQRRHYPDRLSRKSWLLLHRLFFCTGGLAWGVLSGVVLATSGIEYPFFIALLINIGILAGAVQNIALDLVLARIYAPLMMAGPILVAAARGGQPGYLLLCVLMCLFVVYQLVIARQAHALIMEAIGNRALIVSQKDQVEALLEAMPGFVVWTEQNGRLLGMNRRSEAELGPEALARLSDAARRFAETAKDYAFDEDPLPTSRGLREHLLGLRRWRAVEGDRVVLTALDVEARKSAEREAELARMQAVESARLGALGTMAAGIAHEINNPLQVLRYASTMLKSQLAGMPYLSGRCRPILERVDRTVDRMASIVGGLRNFARDGHDDPFERVPVSTLVKEVTELVATSRATSGTELRVEPVPEDLMLVCRRTEVGQLLVNVLNNAFDAVAPLSERWVAFEVNDVGEQVEFVITDSGPGIPTALLDQIMNPFFTTKAGAGTGLGLPISRSIAERHNGWLGVDTAAAHTRFVVRLPKQRPEEAMLSRLAQGEAHP